MMAARANGSQGRDWLVGGGEMGKLVRSMDWSKTPLGAIDEWPQSLRTTVSLCLASSFPMSMAWGPHHIQIYNDGYWPICGAKHPSSMGQDFTECWASPWPVIGDAFESALRGETRYLENQWMFLDRHGYLEETCFTFSFSPIRDESGGVGGLFHPVTEVTSKMVGERRIRVLRDLAAGAAGAHSLEDALNASTQVMALHDHDLPFAFVYLVDPEGSEARLAAATGAAPPPVAPTVIALDVMGQHGWPLARVVKEGCSLQVDDLEGMFGPFVCGPYPETPRTALLLPISLPGGGRPVAVLIAGTSSRLPLDDAYRAFYDLLAGAIVSAAAGACAYAEERKRAEALAEIDRAKTEFFSNVSHEFRTPLTLMLGPLEDELAERTERLPAPRYERLQTAHRNSLRLLRLVNALLDFSRIEAGRIQARYEETDLAAYTRELASTFRSAIEKVGLSLSVECAPLPEAVYVDREMWEKIVLNLLSNALKHTFEGGIEVLLRWRGDFVEFSVTDSGVGIPKAELPRVFERFHRVKGVQARTHEGTGIGLALVQEFVHAHGGTVRVESEEGRGSTFSATVKTGRTHLPPEKIATLFRPPSGPSGTSSFVEEASRWLANEAKVPAEAPAAPVSARSRILWADDNADMRDYVRRLLEERYDVTAVPDGLAAVRAALSEQPDLVLTDVMMPGLDGFGVLRALRADARTQTTPVILLSARAGEEASVEGMDAGADDYLVKPFSARELLARIGTHLRLAQLRKESMEIIEQRAEERRQAAVHASEERVREHARAIDLAQVLIRDMDSRIVLWTKGDESLYGFTQEEAIGQIAHELLRAEFPEPLSAVHQKLRDHGVWEGEVIRHRKDGSRVIVAVSWVLHNDGDKPSRVVETDADMTKLRKAEAALIQAQKTQAIGTLASGIAHDFNNLLAAIVGNAEFASADLPDDHPAQASIAEIREASARATQLVRQILTFSRPGHAELQRVSLQSIAKEALKLLRSTLPAMIEINSRLEPGAPEVLADATQVHQVIMNLGTNAAHAMERGGLLEVVLTHVGIGPDEAAAIGGIVAGAYIRVSVTDTGTGMDRATLERIFDPFFTTKAPGKGTGLGLAVVQGIMRSHNGAISVYSEVGKGTAFHLYFPAVALPVKATTAAPAAIRRGKGQHVLCVDDERSVLAVITRMVEKLGYRASSYGDASTALSDFRAHPGQFDVVVTDLALRGMSGLDLAAGLLQIRPDIPIILTSGYFSEKDQERAARMGITELARKPTTPVELGDTLFRALHPAA
jgi:PAS domain S-box-containing protein